MRTIDYEKRYARLLQPDIVSLITRIHEYKGEQTLLIKTQEVMLAPLLENAKLQSIEASNRMEGICTSDDRLKKIVCDKTMPRTRHEREIAGYRDVLNTIHENYDYIPVKASMILQLHQDLFKFIGNVGGHFQAAESIDRICEAFQIACGNPQYDPLLLIPMFVLDFLYIHPFRNGNGRMSRLLTLLLLYRFGYLVGMYISIEKLMEQTKETYYKTLQESALNWQEGNRQDRPFVRYMLGILAAVYKEFSSRAQFFAAKSLSKSERVKEIVRGSFRKITRAQIMEQCPDISRVTVERTLTNMVKQGEILKINGGRYTAYIWNRERKEDDYR